MLIVRLDKPVSGGLATSVMRQQSEAKDPHPLKFITAFLDAWLPRHSPELVLRCNGDFEQARI